MKYYKTFKDIVGEGYSEEVALTVIQLLTLQLSKDIKDKHFEEKGSFKKEVVQSFVEIGFEVSEDVIVQSLKVWEVIDDYQTRKSLQGLGGCQAFSIKQLVEMGNLNNKICKGVEKLNRGQVWCHNCGKTILVNSSKCMSSGWPECCGETMSIDSPEERKLLKGNMS